MIIFGIDPGTKTTGYGFIKSFGRGEWGALDFGSIRPPATASIYDRYLIIFEAISHLIEEFRPHSLSVETQFIGKNVQSSFTLGIVRGIAILAAAKHKIDIFEYAPSQAKQAVVGKGMATKQQVQKMVQLHLKLAKLPHPTDAADALALALCHAYHIESKNRKVNIDVREHPGNSCSHTSI